MQQNRNNQLSLSNIRSAPKGIAILALIGPSFVWCAEYIGSGEVIIAPRTGAVLGNTVLWAIVAGVFLKFWIGLSGARYTVCTGEAMIDMFDRIPGPRHWVVWLVLFVQSFCGILAIGTIAASAGTFLHSLIPTINPKIWGWFVAFFAATIAWTGLFEVLKIVMSAFVLIIVLGALYIAIHVFPTFAELLYGLTFKVPAVPEWAHTARDISANPWQEILPLLGWGAGGFASQVWYTYWVLGAGYGAANQRPYGKPADTFALKQMTIDTAKKVKGWCRVLYFDATVAMLIGITVTAAFFIAGAGILRPEHVAPQNEDMAQVLSQLFAQRWSTLGGFIFKLSAAIALVSTLVGILAGWPRLLADTFRICLPRLTAKYSWKIQFRFFLIFFFCTSMVIIYTLGLKPISLLKVSSILEGVLLTALQAIWVAVGLFVVMPRILSKNAYDVLKPHPIFAIGLLVASLVFGYICLIHIPPILEQLLTGIS